MGDYLSTPNKQKYSEQGEISLVWN